MTSDAACLGGKGRTDGWTDRWTEGHSRVFTNNTEAQTDLHREDCHGSRQGGTGGDTDQGTAKEEVAVPGSNQPGPPKSIRQSHQERSLAAVACSFLL